MLKAIGAALAAEDSKKIPAAQIPDANLRKLFMMPLVSFYKLRLVSDTGRLLARNMPLI
jgi:hypothetical protein